MASVWANREITPHTHRIDPTPAHPRLRAAKGVNIARPVLTLSLNNEQQVVLTALVERFGGEVTGSALTHYLSRQLDRPSPATGPIGIAILHSLQNLGLVSLEANGGDDLIVRLLPDPAERQLSS